MAKRKKLLRDKSHMKHRLRVRAWREKHPKEVYKKVEGKYRWTKV